MRAALNAACSLNVITSISPEINVGGRARHRKFKRRNLLLNNVASHLKYRRRNPDFDARQGQMRAERNRLAQAKDVKRLRLRSVDERRSAAVRRQSDSYEALRAGRVDELGAEALAHADVALTPRSSRKRRLPAAEVGAAFLDNFTDDQLKEIDAWVYENAEKDGQVLTRAEILEHLRATYGVNGTKRDLAQLLKSLHYKYDDIKNGYYFAKANKAESANHRTRLLPLLAFILAREDLFVFACQDEKAFRMFLNPTKKYRKIGDTRHALDMRATTMTGPGFDMSSGMDRTGAITTADGEPVGYLNDTTKKARAPWRAAPSRWASAAAMRSATPTRRSWRSLARASAAPTPPRCAKPAEKKSRPPRRRRSQKKKQFKSSTQATFP